MKRNTCKLYPGMLTLVKQDSYNQRKGITVRNYTNEFAIDGNSVWMAVPMTVIAYFPEQDDHNVMLIGSNGVIGWLPEEWVKPC